MTCWPTGWARRERRRAAATTTMTWEKGGRSARASSGLERPRDERRRRASTSAATQEKGTRGGHRHAGELEDGDPSGGEVSDLHDIVQTYVIFEKKS
uniref:Uncharacterized protein n=1 Tax=Oryza sativa subsp. japonica TaxID=39947 RepID=Q8H2L3_ORYSJ|nr:hypothetical protein [Oryza sativa Japonica Group]